jgi:hypothetical protein
VNTASRLSTEKDGVIYVNIDVNSEDLEWDLKKSLKTFTPVANVIKLLKAVSYAFS